MTPFECYQAFVALKRHFALGSTYSYHRYNGKTNASRSSFETRSDQFYFEKLAKKHDPVGYMVANISHNPKVWIGELLNEDSETRYRNYVAHVESLTYITLQQMKQFDPFTSFDELFTFRDGQHPPALKALLNESISIYVLAAVDSIVGFTGHWSKYSWDPTVKDAVHRIRKLQGFFPVSRDMIATGLKKIFVSQPEETVAA